MRTGLRYVWLLTVILLTWQSVDPRYAVEVQRRTGKAAWTTVDTVYGHTLDDTVGRGHHCWRVRYTTPGAPQTSRWTNLACVRVR